MKDVIDSSYILSISFKYRDSVLASELNDIKDILNNVLNNKFYIDITYDSLSSNVYLFPGLFELNFESKIEVQKRCVIIPENVINYFANDLDEITRNTIENEIKEYFKKE